MQRLKSKERLEKKRKKGKPQLELPEKKPGQNVLHVQLRLKKKPLLPLKRKKPLPPLLLSRQLKPMLKPLQRKNLLGKRLVR
jgi:hypothetical protein